MNKKPDLRLISSPPRPSFPEQFMQLAIDGDFDGISKLCDRRLHRAQLTVVAKSSAAAEGGDSGTIPPDDNADR